MIPQRRAPSGIMTLADLNNCAALRHKPGMDLDPMEFKPCIVDRGWKPGLCSRACDIHSNSASRVDFYTALQQHCQIYPNYFTVWFCLCKSHHHLHLNFSARHAPPLLFWDCRHCVKHWSVIRLECVIWFCLSIFMHFACQLSSTPTKQSYYHNNSSDLKEQFVENIFKVSKIALVCHRALRDAHK